MASNSFLQAQGQEWIHQHKRSLQLLFHPDKEAATTLKVQPLMQALWLQFQKVQESQVEHGKLCTAEFVMRR
jgi:hypothetical protein